MNPAIACIVITGYGTVETAVNAMKLGAVDFLCKPFDDGQLLHAVTTGLMRRDPEDPADRRPAFPPSASHRTTILLILERAAREPEFIARLTEEGSGALEQYDLTPQERAAIASGDIGWIESRVGTLTERQKVWFGCRLEQERW